MPIVLYGVAIQDAVDRKDAAAIRKLRAAATEQIRELQGHLAKIDSLPPSIVPYGVGATSRAVPPYGTAIQDAPLPPYGVAIQDAISSGDTRRMKEVMKTARAYVKQAKEVEAKLDELERKLRG